MLPENVKEYLSHACCAGFDIDQIKADLKEFCSYEYDSECSNYFSHYCASFNSIWADPAAHESMELLTKINQVY